MPITLIIQNHFIPLPTDYITFSLYHAAKKQSILLSCAVSSTVKKECILSWLFDIEYRYCDEGLNQQHIDYGTYAIVTIKQMVEENEFY